MSDTEKSASELMTESLQELQQEEVAQVEEQTAEEPVASGEPDPVELQAREMGWTPENEYKGDPAKYVDAGEFIRRQELFDKIHHEVNARKKIEKQLAEVTKYVKNLTDSEYNRQLAQLRAQRQMALEEQDVAAADQVNEKIVDLTAQRKVQEQTEQEEQVQESAEEIKAQNQAVLTDWVVKNQWFNDNMDLREMADDYAEQFALKNPTKSLNELLVFVDQKMQKHVAKLNQEQSEEEEVEPIIQDKGKPMSKVTPARTTTRRPAAKPKVTKADLDSTQRSIMESFVRTGVMTEQEYIDSLVAMGEVASQR